MDNYLLSKPLDGYEDVLLVSIARMTYPFRYRLLHWNFIVRCIFNILNNRGKEAYLLLKGLL